MHGCSIFIGERRRNDFKCLQKLPRHQRFLIICIISIALIAAALIICRFMFSSGHGDGGGGGGGGNGGGGSGGTSLLSS